VDIPNFPECDHTLVKSLFHHSDYDLVKCLQQQPESGRYFTALFCRYSPVVYSLIRHSARSPVQSGYLFALTWRHILHELGGIELPSEPADRDANQPDFSLQSWLINLTAACINQTNLPEVESIHYTLEDASPPLWCYVSQALDSLKPMHRLIVLMAQTFHWSETRIAAYLQAEGVQISPKGVQQQLALAYQSLEAALPADIRAIYLSIADQDPAEATELDDFLEVLDLDLSPAAGNPVKE
jgi:hypothetical protein